MTIAPPSNQLNLFQLAPSFNITKNAQARNAYGTIAQEIVCATLGLRPIPINGNYDCCFDALLDDTFYEIKSVKRGGKVVCYDWRMRKEANAGVALNYAILVHGVRGSDGKRLFHEFTESRLQLIVAPAQLVHGFAYECGLHRMGESAGSRRCGYNRVGYRDGYRNLPVRALYEFCTHTERVDATYAKHRFSLTLLSCPPATANPF